MPPYAILFVVHDDFLQGDDCARLFRPSSVYLTLGQGQLSARPQAQEAKADIYLPKGSFSKFSLQLIVSDAGAAAKASPGSLVGDGKGARRSAIRRRGGNGIHGLEQPPKR